MRHVVGARRWLVGTSLRQRSPARRRSAWVLAVAGPALLVLALLPFGSFFALSSVLLFVLLIVVAVAVIGGVRPALAAVLVGLGVATYLHVHSYGRLRQDLQVDLVKMAAFAVVGTAVAVFIDGLTRIAGEQAALRRVATHVARGAPPEVLFSAVTEEIGQLLPVESAAMVRYDADDTVTAVADWARGGSPMAPIVRVALGGDNVTTWVVRTGRPARMDRYAEASGPMSGVGQSRSTLSAVGAPILVEGRIWGVMIVATSLEPKLPADTEARLADFTDLVATAIANAESRGELAASRARVVTAADDARRRIERDLHDGIQQRLVSLGLELHALQGAVPTELHDLAEGLSLVAEGLTDVQDELLEMARGIHPAILARGGLGPALKTLARRSSVPVELDVRAERRLPEPVEVATYYVASEALTNVTKHANASVVHLEVETTDRAVRVSVQDDGSGGADLSRGSGLVGLKDRVEALGGTIVVQSLIGAGTSLRVELPLDD